MKLVKNGLLCLIMACLLLLNNGLVAQSDSIRMSRKVLFTLVYNDVPSNSGVPLVGMINRARGDYQGLQLGFLNFNDLSFKGLQLGFMGVVRGNVNGLQLAFLNVGKKNVKGAQLGFVNNTRSDLNGAEVGFVNLIGERGNGLQIGFLNATKKSLNGAQIGFLNVSDSNVRGAQIGFLNLIKGTVSGFQLGFVNLVDSVSEGVALGFLSYVKRGGYRAIEVSSNELYPVNIGFKIGTTKLYSIIQTSYSSEFTDKFAIGTGLGSLFRINQNWSFSPEAVFSSSLNKQPTISTSLRFSLRYSLSKHLQLAGGLSAVQYTKAKDKSAAPWFKITDVRLDDDNRIVFGAGVSLIYNFTEL